MATISRIEGMQLADLKARAKIKILETDVNALKNTYTNDQVDKLIEDLKADLTTGPDAPYTKAEVDGKIDTVQKAIDVQYGNDIIDKKIKEAKDEVQAKIDAGYSNDQIDAKINKVNQDLSTTINSMYTNAQIDKKITDAVDGLTPGGTSYSKAEIDTKFTEVNKSIVDKLDGYVKSTDLNTNYYTKDQVYNKTEIETDYYKKDELLSKTEIETNYINKTDGYTKTQTDDKIDEKIDAKVGDLTTLTTTEKTNLVGALNEVKDSLNDALNGKLAKPTVDGTQGQVLSIDADGNIVWSNSAFNADGYYNKEQSDNRYYTKTDTDDKIEVVSNSVGDITRLKTASKDSTVGAINELKTSIDGKMNNPTVAGLENQVLTVDNDGNAVWKNSNFNPDLYYDKTTTDSTFVKSADSANTINELKASIDTKITKPTVDGTQGQILSVSDDGSLFWKDFNLDNIDMSEYYKKTETDDKIKEKTGDLTTLTTTANDNLVNAINELKASNDDIPNKFSTEKTDTKFDIKYDNNSIASIGLVLDDNTISGGDGTFNIDLSPYQTKEDTSLPTTNKTISGAIKEIYARDTMIIKSVLVDDDTGAVVDNDLTIEVKLS